MNKRTEKKYLKEINESLEKHMKLLLHHLQSVMVRYSRDVWKLNNKYFNLETK